jgi:hypothetical protein
VAIGRITSVSVGGDDWRAGSVQLRLALLAAAVIVPFVLTWLVLTDADEGWPLYVLWSLPSVLAALMVRSRDYVSALALAWALSLLAMPAALGFGPGYLLQPVILLVAVLRDRKQGFRGYGG